MAKSKKAVNTSNEYDLLCAEYELLLYKFEQLKHEVNRLKRGGANWVTDSDSPDTPPGARRVDLFQGYIRYDSDNGEVLDLMEKLTGIIRKEGVRPISDLLQAL